MSFRYFVIQPDGTAETRRAVSREQFLLTDLDQVVGVEGHARVRLHPGWLMAGYVNDCGLLPSLNLERNVIGGCLLGVLGGAQQPYAGPVVVVGWDDRATYMGEVEVCSLSVAHVDALGALVAGIRRVLGLDPQGPEGPDDPLWAADVRTFADYIRNGEAPVMRVVSGDDAVAALLADLRRREEGR